MTREPETREEVGLTYCARHPDVETGLECGRCGTPICPRCMIHTPGGIRCVDCARLRRPVMYELSAQHYLFAALAALAVAIPLGILGAIVVPIIRIGFFGLILGFLAGSGAGALMAEAISRATGHKRGLALQLTAAAGMLLAGGIYLVGSGLDVSVAVRDLVAWAAVVGGIVAAWGRLR